MMLRSSAWSSPLPVRPPAPLLAAKAASLYSSKFRKPLPFEKERPSRRGVLLLFKLSPFSWSCELVFRKYWLFTEFSREAVLLAEPPCSAFRWPVEEEFGRIFAWELAFVPLASSPSTWFDEMSSYL